MENYYQNPQTPDQIKQKIKNQAVIDFVDNATTEKLDEISYQIEHFKSQQLSNQDDFSQILGIESQRKLRQKKKELMRPFEQNLNQISEDLQHFFDNSQKNQDYLASVVGVLGISNSSELKAKFTEVRSKIDSQDNILLNTVKENQPLFSEIQNLCNSLEKLKQKLNFHFCEFGDYFNSFYDSIGQTQALSTRNTMNDQKENGQSDELIIQFIKKTNKN